MLRRLRSWPWILALCLAACVEGEISLLEPPRTAAPSDAAACDPDPRAANPCSDAGVGGAAGAGGASGSAGTTADAGACSSSTPCTSGGRPICNEENGLCVECTDDGHCDSDRICDSVLGECVEPCTANADCSSGDRPVCDVPRRVCVQCRDDLDCRTDEPKCLLSQCVECVSNGDCSDPSNPLCADDHHCRSN